MLKRIRLITEIDKDKMWTVQPEAWADLLLDVVEVIKILKKHEQYKKPLCMDDADDLEL